MYSILQLIHTLWRCLLNNESDVMTSWKELGSFHLLQLCQWFIPLGYIFNKALKAFTEHVGFQFKNIWAHLLIKQFGIYSQK